MDRRVVILAAALAGAALSSDADDWKPLSLVLALAVVMLVADGVVVWTRRLRFSGGLLAQVPIMALLGPAPAVALGVVSTSLESWIYKVRLSAALTNVTSMAVMGLVGGLLFEVFGAWLDLDREDAAYAALVVPIYIAMLPLNLVVVLSSHREITAAEQRRVLRESALPGLPLELAAALMATGAVLAWSYAGTWVAVGLLAGLAIMIPLARTVGDALISDERAAEVASLASDRDRLVVEVLNAEERERARLAETLHDGPMQRLMAMRQDVGDGTSRDELAAHLDRTIAETRAIISAFHPASVRALGFEASLRAAVEPFPAASAVALTVDTTIDDHALAESLAMPVARELVVNAVKHADPTRIEVTVRSDVGQIVVDISDDGVGIDSAEADRAVQAGHLGLAMVRRRVEDAGGELQIATRADGGTHSRVVLPASTEG
jgi:signal transduction histidine kinase